ncbi:MAG: cytochrome c biogenesis protein CcsA, partial [Verrucomicrobiota bacterium]|nr:cytochrome c biogenesis protein CcsA [Verrucomicrobiota bacterium]
IPVQDGGRVKPFETRAGFLMLKLHGARKMKIKSGEEKISIGPTEWLLDILFRPELAMKMPTFRLDDSDLLKEVGMDVKNRRDRYSYVDLEPYLQEIGKKAGDIQKQVQEETRKNPDYKFPRNQTDPRALARKIMEYQGMLATHDFARYGLTLEEGAEVANGEEMRKVSYWVKLMPVLGEMLRQEGLAEEGQIPPHVQKLLNEMSFRLGRGEGGIEWLPPYEAEVVLAPGGEARIHSGDTVKTFEIGCEAGEVEVLEGSSSLGRLKEEEDASYPGADLMVRNSSGANATIKVQGREWMSAGKRLAVVSNGLDLKHWELFSEDLAALENLYAAAKGKESEFAEKLDDWRDELTARATALGEKESKIESEVTYYKRNYFIRGLVWFILAFIVAAISWLAPASGWGKWTYRITWVLGVLGAVYLVAGIIHRCILMGRPPVGNLYDTIPFIAGGGVLVLFLLEAVTRRRIALGAAITVGLLGLFLARAFEGVDAQDHMDPLRAVLRSNFWLSTHVIIITLGYAGGLIAAAMSHVYLYARAFGLDRSDRSLRRFLTRSVYGLVCFTLFFSLVGTVLGGIWANDSWGRFWGWDPKENGAMLIVLWCLIILHARMGGYLKEWGLHIASVLGAIVVAFSWWGVNLLGTGLHSYGFTEGIGGAVKMFYLFEFAVALGGIVLAVLDKRNRRMKSRADEGDDQGGASGYPLKQEALEQ